ncbi:MAG: nitrous oxide reductase accessory protein NosL [Bacteroidota bacterium]
MKKILLATIFLLVISIAISCQSGPEPIAYGEDNCANCMMTISDPKYGSELISDKGKIFKFDSIECLADYSTKVDSKTVRSMWVTDFSAKGNFLNAKDARFLRSDNLRSPMGLNLSAHKNNEELNLVKSEVSGEIYRWNELVKYVKSKWN